MNKKLLTLGMMAGAFMIYKGKEIRSSLSMTGAGWDNLHPTVKQRAKNVIKKANKEFKKTGLSIGIFEGWRTEARQREVMGSGSSWVKDYRNSYHPWGLAVDFVFLDQFGQWTWEPIKDNDAAWYEYVTQIFTGDANAQAWDKLGDIIKAEGFEWGGDWKNRDAPHAQVTEFGTTRDMIAQYGEPDNLIYNFA